MNPADKVAFTGALKAAVAALDDEARVEFLKWAAEQKQLTGADRFKPKFGGTLIVASGEEQIRFKADEIEAWMVKHQPHNVETVTRIRPMAEKALMQSLRIVAGEVVREVLDKETGEVRYEDFPAAMVVPGRAPYASWKDGAAAKDEVTAWLRGRYDLVAELLAGDTKAVES